MTDIFDILLRTVLIVGSIILLTRLQGLRSFSKLSGFDFAITVSVGSILAAAVTTLGTGVHVFAIALAALFLVQFLLTRLRVWRDGASALDNAPLLIMEDGVPLQENMKLAGVTHADLRAKLREANAFDLATVHAVVVETTGDVSVLHGPADGPRPDARVMEDVQRQ
ncbi:YetF domain-containing protein [uncultured Tateyamaria sp.]|uniref:DUF421 domain-containing protein n=1 Tax=uncultured Tateyamaria sp. TaxID=455651 RepID=UPI002627AE0E|nr:YetF domain-containing protein [uncultured Tateyamaria sp.]